MSIKRFLAGATVAMAAAALVVNTDAQMTKSARQMLDATMQAYDQIIKENPNDYRTLYKRANGHYNHNSYGKALADVNEALRLAPASEKQFLFDCYSLRAGIKERLGDLSATIADYQQALKYSPDDYNANYQLANNQLKAGQLAAAKETYSKLKRLNPKSQEALFGLARVALKEGNLASANQLMKDALDLNPTSATTYMRQASLLRAMGNNVDAVDSYTVALQLDSKVMPQALREMAALSSTDYNAVMNGLQKAIDKNPRAATFYYIRGMIAKSHFHYIPALTDFNYIVDRGMLNIPGVYTMMAECYYNLGNYPKAIEMTDYAIGSSRDNKEAYLVKSTIKYAQGSYKSAAENAQKALDKDPDYSPAIMALGLAQEGLKFYAEANNTMSRATSSDLRYPIWFFERAYLLATDMNLPTQAPAFYNDVLKLNYSDDKVESLKGFAYLFLGDTAAGDAWMDHLTTNVPDSDGEIAYYAACYWAQRGETAKALGYVAKALDAGYASYHNWTAAIDGGVNVAPLRDNADFQALLQSHAAIFGK